MSCWDACLLACNREDYAAMCGPHYAELVFCDGCDGSGCRVLRGRCRMTTIPLNWTKPPMTKNKARRMHHHAEAKLRREVVEQARWTIRAATTIERIGRTR